MRPAERTRSFTNWCTTLQVRSANNEKNARLSGDYAVMINQTSAPNGPNYVMGFGLLGYIWPNQNFAP